MNKEQIANFTYWLLETTDHRGIKNINGKEKIKAIEKLIPEFLAKYPYGILTGWNQGE